MSELYNHKVIEKKWQDIWDREEGVCRNMRLQQAQILCAGGVSLPVGAGTACWSPKTLYGA